jgi:dipeptidyl aminopeptidase/acylaminoacyl peptidase
VERHVYRQLTYLPQFFTNARFGPDGQTVVFSSPPEGNRAGLFVRRPEDPLPQQLGADGTHLLGVSSQGELAVLTGARWLYHRTYIGTLARMPLASAAPRKILEDISAADWSPDGQELAIVRRVGVLSRLEYPPGKVLAETAGYLSDVRVSPRGDRIAYMEHLMPFDNRGRVVVVDLEGKVLARSPESHGEEGLVWSAGGERVLFSAIFESGRYSIWSMAEDGSIRELASDSQDLFVLDRAPDGRLLVVSDDERDVLVTRLAGEPEERDASWLGSSVAVRLSKDGRSLLFSDQSSFSGINYAAYLLEAGGGPPLRVGEGYPYDLSRDGSLVLAAVPSEPTRLVLYPTGAGAPRDISVDGITSYQTADFLADGKSVLACGAWENRSGRCFVRKLDEESARAVSAEGTAEGYPDPSGRVVLARRDDGAWVRFPLEDGTQQAVPGLTAEDSVMRVGRDAESVRVFQRATVPTRIEDVDLETGERTLVRTLGPSDLDGVIQIWFVAFSDDESAYAYNYPRTLGQLLSIEGVR